MEWIAKCGGHRARAVHAALIRDRCTCVAPRTIVRRLSLLPNRLSSPVCGEKNKKTKLTRLVGEVSARAMSIFSFSSYSSTRRDRQRFTLVELPAFDICKAIFRRAQSHAFSCAHEGRAAEIIVNPREYIFLLLFPPHSLLSLGKSSRVGKRKKYQMEYEKALYDLTRTFCFSRCSTREKGGETGNAIQSTLFRRSLRDECRKCERINCLRVRYGDKN